MYTQYQAVPVEQVCPSLSLVGDYSMDRLYTRLEALLVDTYECHLDLRRCTRAHRLAEAESLVQYLAERVRSLYVSSRDDRQTEFCEVLCALGRCHGLTVTMI